MLDVLYEADGQKKSKNITSFSNPSVFKTLKESSKGATFEVDTIKDDKGYIQWKGISTADGSQVKRSTEKEPEYGSKTSTAPVNRSFETKEERDARQRLIVRQSSLTAALSTLGAGAKAALDPVAVKALASDYTDWVFEKVDIFDQPNDLE